MKATVAEIEKAIHDKRGNVAAVARSFGMARKNIYERINKSERLQNALENARATMLDNAETVLYEKVLEGHTAELIFFLKTQGKNRGYTEKQEIDHGGGIDISVEYINDWRNEA